jgi:hypothetical protein
MQLPQPPALEAKVPSPHHLIAARTDDRCIKPDPWNIVNVIPAIA